MVKMTEEDPDYEGPWSAACPHCGSDCNERDELTKAEREITCLHGELEALRADASAVIRQCRDALAEELSAYDIQPPIYHVLKAHERCVAWLSVRAEQGAST